MSIKETKTPRRNGIFDVYKLNYIPGLFIGGIGGGGVWVGGCGALGGTGDPGPFFPNFLATNQMNRIKATTATISQKRVIIII